MPDFVRIKVKSDGWEGDVHPADARVLVGAELAELVAEEGAEAAKPKPRRKAAAKAQPVETAAQTAADSES